MHRTDGADNIDNRFTDNIPGTIVGANWLNAVQEEIAGVIEGAGMSLNNPSADTANQLLAAINDLINGAIAVKTLEDYPIGDIYVQYPVAESNDEATAFPTAYRPATKFGGTWAELYDDENVFFRTKGTDYQTRTAGLSADQFQGHRMGPLSPSTHFLGQQIGGGVYYGTTSDQILLIASTGDPITDGTNGTPRTGAVTESRNRLFKVWIRTA